MSIEYFVGGMLVGLGNQRQQWTSVVEPQPAPPCISTYPATGQLLHTVVSFFSLSPCRVHVYPCSTTDQVFQLELWKKGFRHRQVYILQLQTQASMLTDCCAGTSRRLQICLFENAKDFFCILLLLSKKHRNICSSCVCVHQMWPWTQLDVHKRWTWFQKRPPQIWRWKWNCKFWRCSPPLVDIKTSTEEASLFLKLTWCLRLYENIHFVSLYFLHWFSINGTIGKYSLATVFWKRQQKLAICVRHKTVWPLALSRSRNGDCC